MTQTPTHPAAPDRPRNDTKSVSRESSGGDSRARDPARAPSNGFVRLFLPGLVLGLVVGGLAGAVLPTFLSADQPPLRPVAGADTSPPPMSRAEREAAEAAAEHLYQQTNQPETPPQAEADPGDPAADPE